MAPNRSFKYKKSLLIKIIMIIIIIIIIIIIVKIVVIISILLRLCAWNSLLWTGTGKRKLIEDCLITTEETKLFYAFSAIRQGLRKANMKDFAIIGGISIVTISEPITAEGRVNATYDQFSISC